jgi:CubicO group peptidase (beta-lactamase class C family)
VPTLNQSRSALNKTELYPFIELIDNKIAAVMMGHLRSPALDTTLEIASLSFEIIRRVLRQELAFNGLVVTDGMQMKAVTQRYNSPQANMYALLAGNDLLVFPNDIVATLDSIERSVASDGFPIEVLDAHCRRILNTKYFFNLHRGAPPINTVDLVKKLNAPSLQSIKAKIIENAVILATDKKNSIPLRGIDTARIALLEVGEGQGSTFLATMQQYTDIRRFSVKQNQPNSYLHLLDTLAAYHWVIVGYFGIQQRMPQRRYDMNADFCAFLLKLAQRTPTIMSLFASPYTTTQLLQLEPYNAVLIAHDVDAEYQKSAAEAIFGAIPIVGKSPVTVPKLIALGQGIERKSRTRLKYGTPQELKIATTHLTNIDNIVRKAIADKAFPGCQILAVHKGVVFYNKNFGYHTYDQKRPVTSTDLYDVASLSKVLGTLPVIMKMCDNKTLALNDQLQRHIRFDAISNKKGLTINNLLMHQSGLKAWIPLHAKYLVSSDATPLLSTTQNATHPVKLYSQVYINTKHHLDTAFFAAQPSAGYPFPVADSIWANAAIRKDIYAQIDSSAVGAKTYNYSDLGFYYLQRVIEKKDGVKLNSEVERLFYKPLNMRHTTYLPLQKFDKQHIVPTELESTFRRQLIHGYVHDQGAAIMGGVAGHAGLFSTANDIAIFLQMMLWKGNYGGYQALRPATVSLFTQYQIPTSRRALGFDKPDRKEAATNKKISLSSYGHTGFTGTMIWVDPSRELIYIFLSNRVHPDANNNLINTQHIRTGIWSELVEAVDSKP